jgi:hypothetical protein
MANTAADALIDTIRARAARTGDTVLITEDFVLAELNKGQVDIIKKTPRQKDMDKVDTSTYRMSSAKTVAIGGLARSTNVVTATTSAAHYYHVGQKVLMEDVDSGSETNAFAGTFTVVSVPSTTTFTYAQTGADESNLAEGTSTMLSICATILNPAHIGNLWILDGADTKRKGLTYLPLTEFRDRFIPVSSRSAAEPVYYTRQGNDILFDCPPSSDYDGLYLHIDYTDWATDLENSGGSSSELSDSDDGLILYSLARVFDEIAFTKPHFEKKALKKRVLYDRWLEEYKDYNELCFEELYNDENE